MKISWLSVGIICWTMTITIILVGLMTGVYKKPGITDLQLKINANKYCQTYSNGVQAHYDGCMTTILNAATGNTKLMPLRKDTQKYEL